MFKAPRVIAALLPFAAALPGALAADAPAEPSPRIQPTPVVVQSIQTQRVVWHGKNARGPAATTLRDTPQPVCTPITASVANNFNSYSGGSSMILQMGTVQQEGFASSYSFPASAFPIEVTLFECFFGTIADEITQTGWRLTVYDGPPTLGNVVFTVLSDPDPTGSGLPGDVLMNPAPGPCPPNFGEPPQANAVKLQFSVDQTSDPQDRIIVNNTSGTGIITVLIQIWRHNSPGGTCSTPNQCANAFLACEGQGNAVTFPNDDWLFAISCPGGAPAGFTSLGNLSPTFRPSTDPLHQITIVPTNCTAIPTGACCLNSGACSVGTSQNCLSQAGTYKGDGSTCATANCPQPSGACCLPFGGCDLRSQASCVNVSGVFRGAGSTCATANCTEPSGACCAGSICAGVTTLNTCIGLGGSFKGNGTTCTGGGPCPLGACCLPAGNCLTGLSSPECALQNGTFQGIGSSCASVNCPQPNGACCTSAGGCFEVPQATCTAFPGNLWQGPFTVCSPSPCAPSGVCCRGVICSTTIAQAQCTGPNTLWSTLSSTCNAPGNSLTPCCRADFNKAGGITVQDLFDFLAAWFARDPIADYTGNGAGQPTVQSLFDFLFAWFQKGCP